MPSYVVTGAARGLGLEFVNQLSNQSDSVVFALVRSMKTAGKVFSLGRSNVHVLEADITDVKALKIAANEVSKVTGGSLDVLINNAAFIDEEWNNLNLDEYPEGKEELLEEDLRKSFNINVIGVVHTTNIFLPLLRSPSKISLKKVITLSTGVADLDFTLSTSNSVIASYSISKAALNMVVAKYAAEYKNKVNSESKTGGGIVFLAISPGLVNTKEQLSKPTGEDLKKFEAMVTSFRRLYPDFTGPITPEESVKAVLKVTNNATIEDTGAFISHKGNKEWFILIDASNFFDLDSCAQRAEMQFEIIAKCPVTKARVSKMTLAHGPTMLPTFMPVATQGAIKGLTAQQVEALGVTLILNNTYHLNLRPGIQVLDAAGGAHKFQGWKRNLLTDSGGFQLVSLSQFTKITEEGALFKSPFTGEMTMLSPEESMSIQHSIGADIIMQLDDVVPSLLTGPRVEEAMYRSVRWLDRCIAYHEKSGRHTTQNLFAIVQGGLDGRLRDSCLDEMIRRKDHVRGYAVGGLSGGEAKDDFWRVVKQCTDKLPTDRPRYCMGIGFAEDLLVCIALGVDMADCVFPTRTARFGVALTDHGPLNLRLAKHAKDLEPIDKNCPCPTCAGGMTRAFLHHLVAEETVAAHAVTQHNITFQAQLMGRARDAIVAGTFPEFLRSFFRTYYSADRVSGKRKSKDGSLGADEEETNDGPIYPKWCVDALRSVGVDILEGVPNVRVVDGSGAKWEYAEMEA